MRYWLGLGANLGDTADNLRRALGELVAQGVVVEAVSSAYRTAPRDDVDQPDFLNAAAQVVCDADPPGLLARTQAVERRLGRRKTRRYGPRNIDIDILLWQGGTWNGPELHVPHPRLTERRFALVPLMEITPTLALPDGMPIASALAALDGDPDQSVEAVAGLVLRPILPSA